MESTGKRLTLPDEEPEVLSPILEYLYKGDYSPRLVHNKRRDTWEIESNDEATIFHQATGAEILKDTVIYCAAEKYKLDELKRIALRKQGLRKFSSSVLLRVRPHLLTSRPPTRHRHPLRHHPVLCPLRLRQHFGLGLQAQGPLPRPHHPQPLHLQAQRHHAAGDVQRRLPALL